MSDDTVVQPGRKPRVKNIKPGHTTSEFWAMIGGCAIGGLLTIAGCVIPGAQLLVPTGPGVIAASIAGYQASRGRAKQ